MRTTLTLDDDAFEAARTYAHARDLKLGQAVSELIRRGTAERLPVKRRGSAWVIDVPADTPRLSARRVREALDDGG